MTAALSINHSTTRQWLIPKAVLSLGGHALEQPTAKSHSVHLNGKARAAACAEASEASATACGPACLLVHVFHVLQRGSFVTFCAPCALEVHYSAYGASMEANPTV